MVNTEQAIEWLLIIILTTYLDGVSEMVDLVACFQTVVVDRSIFLVHVLLRSK